MFPCLMYLLREQRLINGDAFRQLPVVSMARACSTLQAEATSTERLHRRKTSAGFRLAVECIPTVAAFGLFFDGWGHCFIYFFGGSR